MSMVGEDPKHEQQPAEHGKTQNTDVTWLRKFINCTPFGEHAPQSDIDRAQQIVSTLESELSTLRAKLAAAEKDAERYRWLREGSSTWGCCFSEKPKFDAGAWWRDGSRWVREALDAAIDAAIEKERGNG